MKMFLRSAIHGDWSFYYGKPRARVGFYYTYYDGYHYSLNLYFFSIGLDY